MEIPEASIHPLLLNSSFRLSIIFYISWSYELLAGEKV
jgi:hypothetical protein